MKKWEITNEGKFYGEAGPSGIGIYAWAYNNYYLGQWDNGERNGLGIRRYNNGNVRFGKFHEGDMSYPTAIVTTKSILEILFDIDSNGIEKHLYLNLDNGDWFFDTYKGDDIVGVRFVYTNKDGAIRMKNYPLGNTPNKEVVIPRHLSLGKPIILKDKVSFPEINNFQNFEWKEGTVQGGTSYTSCENSTTTDIGLGAISWGDGTFAISTWKNGRRYGWNVYKWNDSYAFFYVNENFDRTVEVKVEKSGIVYVCNRQGNDWSCLFKYYAGNISYSHTKNDMYSRIDDGFIIQDGKTVRFVNFKDDNAAYEIASYHLDGTNFFARDDQYKDEISVLSKGSTTSVKEESRSEDIHNDIFAKVSSKKAEQKVSPQPVKIRAVDAPAFSGLVALDEVKEELVKIKSYVAKNNNDNICLNMCFLGNPGTGKELVAEEMAQILASYGATKNSKFVSFSARDIKNQGFGSFSNAVNRNLGGVIYIGDAEELDQPDQGREDVKSALEFVLSTIKDCSGTRTCFILGGSKYLMEEMLYNCGDLSSLIRFRLLFPDFDKNELRQLIINYLEKQKYEINDNALSLIIDILEQKKYAPEYANADTVHDIINKTIVYQNYRTRDKEEDRTIDKKDVEKYMEENSIFIVGSKEIGASSARNDLEKLIGLGEVKKTIDDLIAYFAMNKNKKMDFHMSFLGAPGTGKTEVARIIGRLLHEEGLLPTSKFIECTRDSFIGKYIGHTTPKTRELIKRAMGGVLYVDEAYSLVSDDEGGRDFGKEAVAELLKVMEDRRGEFCVILSGYTNEMKQLFQTNPGFKSRVKFELTFNDYNNDEMRQIAQIFLKKDDYTMTDEALDAAINIVAELRNKPHYASARTLRQTLNNIEIAQAGRIRKLGISTRELIIDDVYAAYGENYVKTLLESNKKDQTVKMVKISELEKQYKNIPVTTFLEAKNRIIEAVIAIRNESERGNSESSGFIISKDGYAATCAHCVNGAQKLIVRVRLPHNGKNIDINYDADVVAIDVPNDVAIIKLRTDEQFEFVPLAPQGVKDLAPLSPIFLLGYPFGFSRFDKMSINEGQVSSYQRNNATGRPDAINIDISAKSGNSGSCVIDGATGQVIGVLCGAELQPHGGSYTEEINYCRPISFVWDLIKAHQTSETEDIIDLMFMDD